MPSNISVGGDPEFWVIDQSGMPVGAYEYFPGTKENPYPLIGGSVQVDGFAVEVNIDPEKDYTSFSNNIDRILEQCEKFIPSTHKFNFDPVKTFNDGYFAEAPTEAKVIGCSPSINMVTGEKIPTPSVMESPARYAGGHIHVGINDRYFDLDDALDKYFLRYIALTEDSSLKEYFVYEGDFRNYSPQVNIRLSNYNANCSIRYKPYGIEFRSPHSWWLNPEKSTTRNQMFDCIQERLGKYVA